MDAFRCERQASRLEREASTLKPEDSRCGPQCARIGSDVSRSKREASRCGREEVVRTGGAFTGLRESLSPEREDRSPKPEGRSYEWGSPTFDPRPWTDWRRQPGQQPEPRGFAAGKRSGLLRSGWPDGSNCNTCKARKVRKGGSRREASGLSISTGAGHQSPQSGTGARRPAQRSETQNGELISAK